MASLMFSSRWDRAGDMLGPTHGTEPRGVLHRAGAIYCQGVITKRANAEASCPSRAGPRR